MSPTSAGHKELSTALHTWTMFVSTIWEKHLYYKLWKLNTQAEKTSLSQTVQTDSKH